MLIDYLQFEHLPRDVPVNRKRGYANQARNNAADVADELRRGHARIHCQACLHELVIFDRDFGATLLHSF